ncbi:hypothetical protein LZL87_013596 [Fusarium oxysporum]|nr:hypothetical protein LZL87_013596 [Fusarium oxysporum]
MVSLTPVLTQLPQELQNGIFAHLGCRDIKNLRATCTALASALPLHFNRVFISANSLNLQVFNAIASHETYRHQVSEIIWDDARLYTGPELEQERQQYELEYSDPNDVAAADGCPLWFVKGRYDYGHPGYIYPEPHIGIEESWAYYKPLLKDQRQVLSSNADIKAFKFGLKRFPSLKRITITPATHGSSWEPLYKTPMIREFPPGFDYPLPEAWPSFDDEKPIDALPWVSENDDSPYQYIYGEECTAEVYRNRWRGFRLVIRALAEYTDHHITELVIGGNEIQSGLNCRIFDQRSIEYDDLVALLKRPGFRYLDLHLFAGLIEDGDWSSYKTGLLHDALAEAKGIEHLCLRASTEISEGAPQQLVPEVEEHVIPLRTIFPVDNWSRLQHFGISHMLADLDDLIDLLAALPPTLRSVDLIQVALGAPEHGYGELIRAMRDVLDWRSRPVEERPKVHLVISASHDEVQGDGKFVEVDDVVYSYLYGSGNNPFEEDGYRIWPGQGAVQRDLYNPSFAAPF